MSEKFASTSFHLSPDIVEELRAASFARRESQAAIVTEAIRAYLKLPPPSEPKLSKAESEAVATMLEIFRVESEPHPSKARSAYADHTRKAIVILLDGWRKLRDIL